LLGKAIYGFDFNCFVISTGSPNWQQLIVWQLAICSMSQPDDMICSSRIRLFAARLVSPEL